MKRITIYALSLVLLLCSPVCAQGQPLAGLVNSGGVAPMTYILRCFGGTTADQDFSNAQSIDTAGEGCTSGSMTATIADGTLAVASNVLSVTAQATPAWADLGLLGAQIADPNRNGLFRTITSADYTKQYAAGWFSNGLALANIMNGIYLETNKTLSAYENGAKTGTALATLTNSTASKVASIVGGYTSAGVPCKTGDTVSTCNYGASHYWYNGANWQLLWKSAAVASTGQQYPALSFYNTAATGASVLVPDYLFSSVLQPAFLDTFTGTDATALEDHTPDVGTGFTNRIGTATIQGNKLKVASVVTYQAVFSTPTSFVGGFMSATLLFPTYFCAIITRYVDTVNWYQVSISTGSESDKIMSIDEYNASTYTNRAQATHTFNANTDYLVTAIDDGVSVIKGFSDGVNVSYSSATSFTSATTKALRFRDADSTADNFAVWPLTSTTYDTEFGKIPGY